MSLGGRDIWAVLSMTLDASSGALRLPDASSLWYTWRTRGRFHMGYFIQASADCDSERTPEPHTRFRGLSGGGLRYYIPTIGRWACRDSIGEKGGWNVYAYAKNSPSVSSDMLGMETVKTGEISVDMYQESKSDPSVVALLMLVSWTPPTWGPWTEPVCCKPCNRVVPLQTVTVYVGYTMGSGFDGPNLEYDESDPGTDGSSQHWIDGKTAFASLGDVPSAPKKTWGLLKLGNWNWILATGSLEEWQFDAITSFKCVEGGEAGTIYGTVKWGARYSTLGANDGLVHPFPYPAKIE